MSKTVTMQHPSDTQPPTDKGSPDPEPRETATTTPALRARGGIDWARSVVTPGLIRGLLAAQRAVSPVGKEGHNADGDYHYAIADSMIGEGRRALNAGDLVWVCASHETPGRVDLGPDSDDVVTGAVVTESVVWHVDDDDVIGRLVSVAAVDIVVPSDRQHDRSGKGAETYLQAFIARDLLRIERKLLADPDSPDARDGGDEPRATQRSRTRDPKLTAAKRLAGDRWKILAELYKQRDGKVPDPHEWQRAHFGGEDPMTADDHELVAKLISEEIASLKDEAAEADRAKT